MNQIALVMSKMTVRVCVHVGMSEKCSQIIVIMDKWIIVLQWEHIVKSVKHEITFSDG